MVCPPVTCMNRLRTVLVEPLFAVEVVWAALRASVTITASAGIPSSTRGSAAGVPEQEGQETRNAI